jgi:predicted AAA+ superfamily ATPase
MDYKRPLQASFLDQLSRLVTVIHVIIGPRQVGNTTIARQIQDAIGIPSIYATADSPVQLDTA